MYPYELSKICAFLGINIHYINITDENAEYSKRIVLGDDYFSPILYINTFLCNMFNAMRVNCDNCQKIFSTPTLEKAHTCSLKYNNRDEEPWKHNPVTGHSSKYK